MASEDNKVVLQYPGGEYEMDIKQSTEGDSGFDISKLRNETGLVTLDPGYTSTGSTESKITFINGEEGILRHRGYDIADLAENASFNEVSYLLIKGHLPNEEELSHFNKEIRHHTLLDEDFKAAFNIFPRNAHPMAVLASSLNILSAYYQDQLNPLDPEQLDKATVRLLAKVPMLAAYAYRASQGKPYMYPDNSLNARENFLRMMFGYPTEEYEVDPVVSKALDKLLILHADHEQNCSTSTVRMIGSAQANMFVAIAGGINALAGPLHGGANEAVLDMLARIRDSGESVQRFVERVTHCGVVNVNDSHAGFLPLRRAYPMNLARAPKRAKLDPEVAAAQFMESCHGTLFKPVLFNFAPPPPPERVEHVVDVAVRVFMAAYRAK